MIKGQIKGSDAPRCRLPCPLGKQSSPEMAGFRRSSPCVPAARCWPSSWGSALGALTPPLGVWTPLPEQLRHAETLSCRFAGDYVVEHVREGTCTLCKPKSKAGHFKPKGKQFKQFFVIAICILKDLPASLSLMDLFHMYEHCGE